LWGKRGPNARIHGEESAESEGKKKKKRKEKKGEKGHKNDSSFSSLFFFFSFFFFFLSDTHSSPNLSLRTLHIRSATMAENMHRFTSHLRATQVKTLFPDQRTHILQVNSTATVAEVYKARNLFLFSFSFSFFKKKR
jgi:hypothetical protein